MIDLLPLEQVSAPTVWDLYFCGICSMQFHPRNNIDDASVVVEASANVATLMVEARRRHISVT